MRRRGVLRLLAGLPLALVMSAATLTERAITVADGDTLTGLTAGNRQVKVRLAGIDALERRWCIIPHNTLTYNRDIEISQSMQNASKSINYRLLCTNVTLWR